MSTSPFDTLVALDEPDLALRFRAVVANDDVAGIEVLLQEDGCVLAHPVAEQVGRQRGVAQLTDVGRCVRQAAPPW